ncbi:MAG: S66 family peptidase [Bacillota bacterium]
MREFARLPKLQPGDKVAVVSPSFAAPGKWPHIYELGLSRLKEVFGLEPVGFPATAKLGASGEERAADLIAAFSDPDIKAVIASIGGDDQVTYIKHLPPEPFVSNPKPFFGYSDNTHFANFLWNLGIPSFYGGSLFTQYAMQQRMDDFTVEYLRYAFFDEGEFALHASDTFNEKGLDWSDPSNLERSRTYETNAGWLWRGDDGTAEGVIWGGCLESIDELLRHNIQIPTLDEFENIILITETSEEMPSAEYVRRVYRALGERGILGRIRGVLVGRPKAWEFDHPFTDEERNTFRAAQQEAIESVMRTYNPDIPLVFNIDFGHTDPQVPMPYGRKATIVPHDGGIKVKF